MYIIISILKVQRVSVVWAVYLEGLNEPTDKRLNVCSTRRNHNRFLFLILEEFCVEKPALKASAGSVLQNKTCRTNSAVAAAQGSQGADCFFLFFWVQEFGSAALLSAKFPLSKVKPRCSEVWINELWRFVGSAFVYSGGQFP